MTPGQKHAAVAAAVWVPVIAYQARELSQGEEGWPFSRFICLLPVWLFLAVVTPAVTWFVPHIVWNRRRHA